MATTANNSQAALGNRDISVIFIIAAAALIVIGAKFWMIARYGNPTPAWDQLDDEGGFVFLKYLGGTLSWSDLLAPHNEHRLVSTRLWLLLWLVLEGYWDPIVQMLANALIYAAAATFFIGAFRSILGTQSWVLFAAFATLVFALPWTWGTTLDGFNVQYYFLELFSIAAIVAIVGARAFAPRWWLALVLLLCGYLSLAGGAATAIAAFALCLVQLAAGARRGAREWIAVVAVGAVAVLMLADMPRHPAIYQAHAVWLFVRAMAEILSWPAATGLTFPPTLIVLAVITYLPSCLASLDIIASRPPCTDKRWLVVAFSGWMMSQIAAVAYARADASVTARYIDMYAFGLPLNAACLLYLLEAYPQIRSRRRLVIAAAVLWLVPVCAGTTLTLVKHTRRDLATARHVAAAQAQNVRAYLDSGDIHALQNNGQYEIPSLDPGTVARVFSQPAIRAILPPALVGEDSARRARQRGIARYTGRAVEVVRDTILRGGFLLMPLGLALFAFGVARTKRAADNMPLAAN